MSKKSFTEVFNEIKGNVSTSPNGKPKKTFSRADFDKLTKALLNEVDYKAETVALRKGELTKKEVEVVKEYRKHLYTVLTDFGVDKQEAQAILDTYEFKDVKGFYELWSEIGYQYISAGKRLDFLPREDFIGSISLKDVEETTKEHRNVATGEPLKVNTKAHKLLEKKSKAPSWMKTKVQ